MQKVLELRRNGDSAEIQDPTVVVTATGELQTNEKAQVYVHNLDLFVTVQKLDDTPAVLSLGKLCEQHGCRVGHPSKVTPDQTREEYPMEDGKIRTSCCPWIVVQFWYQFVFYMANVQDLLADGKTPCERRFREPCKGPLILFGAMVEYRPSSPKD